MYKLLICDDERTIREGIHQSIDWQAMHFTSVGVAKDGAEAWEWISRHEPQFVITDIRMPKMDGIELLKKVMNDYPDTKVTLLSGYSDFTYAQQGLRYRAFDYLLKPTNPESIRDVLERAIDAYEAEANPGQTRQADRENDLPVLQGQSAEVVRFIETKYREDLTLEKAAAQLYVSPGHLNRILKKATNQTFLSYLTKVRIERAKQLLGTRKYNVYEVGGLTGYQDSKYFAQLFRKHEGVTPTEYMHRFHKQNE